MRRRPCASGSEEGVYGGLLAKESHIVEIARSGEVEDPVDGTTGRLIVDACVEKREQDGTDFLMSERRDVREVSADLSRSEERRFGKGGVSACGTRGSPSQ